MSFAEDRIDDFLAIFDHASEKIRAQPGCLSLELLADVQAPAALITLSVWESEEALDRYRSSDLFLVTWAKTKALFSGPPEATSFSRLRVVS